MAVQTGRLISGVFVTTGNPDTVNDAVASVTSVGSQYDLAGQLGAVLRTSDGQREYVYVTLDSGGITPAANQIVFWKDRSAWTVTNKLGDSKENEVCGVIRNAATLGNRIFMLRRGRAIAVKFGGAAPAASGDSIVPKAGSAVADTDITAAGTAATYVRVGVATAASSGGNVTTDVDVE